MKILITGANGYVASLIQLFNPQHQFQAVKRSDVDLSDPQSVRNYFEAQDFDVLVHTAGLAVTQTCEDQPEYTRNINTVATQIMADLCQKRKKRIVFFSTEQCFNGKIEEGPFNEEDELVSITNYGKQKQEADEYIQKHCDDYIVLRFSWLMGLAMPRIKPSANLITNTLQAMSSKTPTLFTVNELRGLTYAQHIADGFDIILGMPAGVYHLSSDNQRNTYEAAKYIAQAFGYEKEEIDAYILPNHERYQDRKRDYRLDHTKINAAGFTLSTFEDDVAMILRDFKR